METTCCPLLGFTHMHSRHKYISKQTKNKYTRNREVTWGLREIWVPSTQIRQFISHL